MIPSPWFFPMKILRSLRRKNRLIFLSLLSSLLLVGVYLGIVRNRAGKIREGHSIINRFLFRSSPSSFSSTKKTSWIQRDIHPAMQQVCYFWHLLYDLMIRHHNEYILSLQSFDIRGTVGRRGRGTIPSWLFHYRTETERSRLESQYS